MWYQVILVNTRNQITVIIVIKKIDFRIKLNRECMCVSKIVPIKFI